MRDEAEVTTRKLKAEILERTALYEGFLKLYRYRFEIEQHGGGTRVVTWELMERGHSVAVLGHDPVRDEVVLGVECRPGAIVCGEYPYREQLIAGIIDGTESPLDAAVREMKEEAGLELRDPVLIHPGAYVSSGGTSEKVALVYGIVDTRKAGGIHGSTKSEDILTQLMPAQVFIDRARSGALNDLKSLMAGYWLAEHSSRRQR
jgi:ADP-ribose pyrophosphatase